MEERLHRLLSDALSAPDADAALEILQDNIVLHTCTQVNALLRMIGVQDTPPDDDRPYDDSYAEQLSQLMHPQNPQQKLLSWMMTGDDEEALPQDPITMDAVRWCVSEIIFRRIGIDPGDEDNVQNAVRMLGRYLRQEVADGVVAVRKRIRRTKQEMCQPEGAIQLLQSFHDVEMMGDDDGESDEYEDGDDDAELQLAKKSSSSSFARKIIRGHYIRQAIGAGDSIEDIGERLGYNRSSFVTCSSRTQADALYDLVVHVGLYRLRWLNPSGITCRRLQSERYSIAAYLKTNAAERTWWQEGQNAPPLDANGELADWRWLIRPDL